jgi:hypothetical protein
VQTFFADLVVLAEEFHPIPFRTRPLKPPAPMVLRLKPRESRSLPGLPRTFAQSKRESAEAKQDFSKENPAITNQRKPRERNLAGLFVFAAHLRIRAVRSRAFSVAWPSAVLSKITHASGETRLASDSRKSAS